MSTNSRFRITALLFLTLATALSAQNLVPGGSLIKCRVSEKISSKVTDAGDPIVCDVSHRDFPYGTRESGIRARAPQIE